MGALHGETAQSSLRVIFRLVFGGLTRVILVVVGTVSLQFQGPLVPISLWPLLEIVAAQVLSTVLSSRSYGVSASIRQLTGYGSEYYL